VPALTPLPHAPGPVRTPQSGPLEPDNQPGLPRGHRP
jgi:hypothetical protein